MNRNKLIIIAAVCVIIAGSLIHFGFLNSNEIAYTTLANTSTGTVEVGVSGNVNATKCIAVITGIHPRETLSIGPEIEAINQFGNDDVKILHYKVTVTENSQDYDRCGDYQPFPQSILR